MEKYLIDYTEMAKNGQLPPTVGREADADRLMYILLRYYKPNPVLIGPIGVGKRSVILTLIKKFAANTPDLPPEFKDIKVVGINQRQIIAETKTAESYAETLKDVINYISAAKGKMILFLNDTKLLSKDASSGSGVPVSEFLKLKIAAGDFKCIISSDIPHFRLDLESDTEIMRHLQTVYIEEPNVDTAIEIAASVKSIFERKHNITIPKSIMVTAVKLADRYVKQRTFPEKALDLIDEAATLAVANGEKALSEKELVHTISLWTGIPVDNVDSEEKKRLLQLEEFLTRRVIGQPSAVRVMAAALRRSRSGLQDPGRPIGTFLYIGTTGTGKTELAKAIAEFLFNDEKAILRLDMSEYMEKQSINRLIGPPPGSPGFENGGLLTEAVRLRPYQVVLFDELEKANPDILTLLLQVLDEGRLTDSRGNAVDFRNTVIIMTSNVAANVPSYKRVEVLSEYLRPELLARIDDIVSFIPLTVESLEGIVGIHVRKLYKKLVPLNIKLEVTEDAIKWMAKETQIAKNGVRQMRRLIQHNIETPLSMLILADKINPERTIYVNATEDDKRLELSYTKKQLSSGNNMDDTPEAPPPPPVYDLKAEEKQEEEED
ncbi:MAG: ATP-dependent Clp protease ATP-binding subunit [Alphaproteobacteria bacterium]|nr:ATP-dependent Clp protease ATP-binding subunit [Alphaproteobacteria bacterium]